MVISGNATIATASNQNGHTPFVPIESVDNSSGKAGTNLIRGVGSGEEAALKMSKYPDTTLYTQNIVKISQTPGEVTKWDGKVDNSASRYAVYVGKSTNLTEIGSHNGTGQDLSPTGVGYFRLLEASG